MKRGWIFGCVIAAAAGVFAPPALAQNNQCDQPGERPDIIVGAIYNTQRYGRVGDITSFAIGTESCNVGTCWANWISGTPDHPVIGQNMFRLKSGRFEHIGQAWLKHGFATLNGNLCSPFCIPADGQHLGVNCSDPYGAGLNGSQSNLGPKFEVNAEAGTHLHPFTAQGQTGDAIYKRIQVRDADLDPALNPGALYFVEAQYVAADDAAANNHFNNNSYRRINVTGTAPTFNIALTGATFQQQPAIRAWAANDTNVQIQEIDRKLVGGAKITDLGGGMWHYEYALQNLISNQNARQVRIPIPRGVSITNIGFRDVDYHSGEPFLGTDWTVSIDTSSNPHAIVWSTLTPGENPNANALRWGTLYNFRFDANVGPAQNVQAFIVPFLNPTQNWKWIMPAPQRCGDNFCDPDESVAMCAADCADLGVAGAVPDGDDVAGTQLVIGVEPGGDLTLDWDDSCLATDVDYEIYEGTIGSWTSHVAKLCTTLGLTTATITPGSGDHYYLVVPSNGSREGSYGRDSNGVERPQGFPGCQPQALGACM